MPSTVEHPLTTYLEEVMGTVVTFTLTTRPERLTKADALALAKARHSLHRADAVFSTWRTHSPVSRLRRGELALEECPREMAEVHYRCSQLRELTEGWFDPWALPGGFDPTGYVKGWAAERACRQFDQTALAGVIVNAAGDVATAGAMPSGDPFRIGIVDPTDRRRIACVVASPGAVATSGTTERGAHLFDPKSGVAAARATSATVTGPSLATADALATALAVSGGAGLGFVARAGYEGLVIGADGQREATPTFPFAER
jgi:thiamine biosynthesis lipoprotein